MGEFKSSAIYYQDEITWCVQVAQPTELWTNIFCLLSIELWIFLIFIICVCGVLLYFVMRFDKQQLSFVYAIGVALLAHANVPVPYNPIHIVPRIYFAFIMFYSLLIVLVCTHSLFSVLTSKQMKSQISTVNSLIDLQFELFADNDTHVFLQQTNDKVLINI